MLFILVENVQLHKAVGNLMSTSVSTCLHQCQLDVVSPLNMFKSVSTWCWFLQPSQHVYISVKLIFTALPTCLHQCQMIFTALSACLH